MALLMLDTHVVVWLYAGLVEKVPPRARQALETSSLSVSPMVLLELQYLYEIGRLNCAGDVVLADLRSRVGLNVESTPFELVAAAALGLVWTRDPFDRLIAAHSLATQNPLLTADATMREHLPSAVWD